MHSIVEYVGSTKGGHCGYCKSEDSSKSAVGMMAYSLSVQHYNALLDRGLRRSGRYLYKPDIMETCCPQYTIRLDTNKFVLSRTQKRVLRRMNDFLMYDYRPKKAIRGCDTRKKSTEPSEHQSEKIAPRLDDIPKRDDGRSKKMNKNEDIKFVDEENGDSNCVVGKGVDKRDRGKKKKTIRRERAFARMRSKGINIEEVMKRRAAKEEARRRTLESFILPYDASKFEHHLQVRLVKVGSNEFNEIADESFEVFLKYQTIIHNDTDRSRRSYENFLVNSPLFDSDQSEENRNKVLFDHFNPFHHSICSLNGNPRSFVAFSVEFLFPKSPLISLQR
ncbi:unnamed protein product [Anisakis simplex]|uniref:Arginyl-tRNA--protein transferase 1 (inferred by orthology to a human protein) n=1 Tax=Anisakis simplex TaxID=6269 RepID=A0A0M3KCH7_ANISI|nr:unnamed protein product [Anisakis simplex]